LNLLITNFKNKIIITQSRKEQKEFDEMMREEIEAGNQFSQYSSYRGYKASNRKKPSENE